MLPALGPAQAKDSLERTSNAATAPALSLRITAADMRDLRKVGDDGYIYRLEYSKTQQAGVKVDSTPDKPILGRSAEALAAWLDAAEFQDGAIFRRIRKNWLGPALLPGSVATQAGAAEDNPTARLLEQSDLHVTIHLRT